MACQIIGSSEEPNAMILPKNFSELLSLCHTLVHFQLLSETLLLQSTTANTQTQSESKRLWRAQPQIGHLHHSFHSGLRTIEDKVLRGRNDWYLKQNVWARHDKEDVCVSSQGLAGAAGQDLWDQANQSPTVNGEKSDKAHSCQRGLRTTDGC